MGPFGSKETYAMHARNNDYINNFMASEGKT